MTHNKICQLEDMEEFITNDENAPVPTILFCDKRARNSVVFRSFEHTQQRYKFRLCDYHFDGFHRIEAGIESNEGRVDTYALGSKTRIVECKYRINNKTMSYRVIFRKGRL